MVPVRIGGRCHPTMTGGSHWWAMPTLRWPAPCRKTMPTPRPRRVGTAHQNTRLNGHPNKSPHPPTAVQAVGWAPPTKMHIGQRTTRPANPTNTRPNATQKQNEFNNCRSVSSPCCTIRRLSNRWEEILTENRRCCLQLRAIIRAHLVGNAQPTPKHDARLVGSAHPTMAGAMPEENAYPTMGSAHPGASDIDRLSVIQLNNFAGFE